MTRIYDALVGAQIKGINIMKRPDIPDIFHYRDNELIGDILLDATEDGKQFIINWGREGYAGGAAGWHGWLPEGFSEMWGIMYAKGPQFRQGYRKNGSIKMVDHYQLLTKILGLPAHPHNGTWSHVADLVV